VLGICGGCQMLGTDLLDPHHVESAAERVTGLGLVRLKCRLESTDVDIGRVLHDDAHGVERRGRVGLDVEEHQGGREVRVG